MTRYVDPNQLELLRKFIDGTLFDDIGDKVANFTKGSNELLLIKQGHYWSIGLSRNTILDIWKSGTYEDYHKPLLNSVREYWIYYNIKIK